MEQKGDTALRALFFALALGAIGAVLFKGAGLGLNFPLWTALAFGAAGYSSWRGGSASRATVAGLVLAALSALGIGWYSSVNVRAADWVAFSAAVGLAALGTERVRVAAASVWELSGRLVAAPVLVVARGLASLALVPWKRLSESRVAQRNTAVLRGALIATPLVLLFGALFSSADAVFSKTVSDAFSFDVNEAFQWTGWAALFAVIGLAVVGGFALPSVVKPPVIAGEPKPHTRVGMTEVSVVMCSLCGLFGLFVAIQFQYLFGGSAAVVATTGLTYAEYARKGFFELVWLALVFCWWLASLYRKTMERFAIGGVAAGFAVVLALNFVTQDVIAARYNVARFGATADLDAAHLAELGAETVPVVLSNWSHLSPQAREVVGKKYEERFGPEADWRGETVSELLARRIRQK